jgi:hypothetical protein
MKHKTICKKCVNSLPVAGSRPVRIMQDLMKTLCLQALGERSKRAPVEPLGVTWRREDGLCMDKGGTAKPLPLRICQHCPFATEHAALEPADATRVPR